MTTKTTQLTWHDQTSVVVLPCGLSLTDLLNRIVFLAFGFRLPASGSGVGVELRKAVQFSGRQTSPTDSPSSLSVAYACAHLVTTSDVRKPLAKRQRPPQHQPCGSLVPILHR